MQGTERRGGPAARGACRDLHVLQRPLPATPAAVKLARLFARAACRAWQVPQAGDDVVLLASELVTAAVRHTVAPRVVLRLLMTPRRLRLEAHDPSARLPGVQDPCSLEVVRAVACRTGADADGPGTRVWAELALPAGGQAGAGAGAGSRP